MPRSLPRQLTVEVDTREKIPLVFPQYISVPPTASCVGQPKKIRILTKKVKLDAGDYRLKECPEICGIERKSGQSELLSNLTTKDYSRFYKALQRFSLGYLFPIMLVEATPSILMADPLPTGGVRKTDPSFMVHRLSLLVSLLHIHLIVGGHSRSVAQRRNVGRFMLHLMVGLSIPTILGIKLDTKES